MTLWYEFYSDVWGIMLDRYHLFFWILIILHLISFEYGSLIQPRHEISNKHKTPKGLDKKHELFTDSENQLPLNVCKVEPRETWWLKGSGSRSHETAIKHRKKNKPYKVYKAIHNIDEKDELVLEKISLFYDRKLTESERSVFLWDMLMTALQSCDVH